MGIYPTRKGTPRAREKNALTEEHTQEQQEELSCPNCGAQLPDEAAKFCPECGAEQQDQQAATNEEPTQPSDEEEEPTRIGPGLYGFPRRYPFSAFLYNRVAYYSLICPVLSVLLAVLALWLPLRLP